MCEIDVNITNGVIFYYITKSTSYDISGKLIYQKIGMHNRSGSMKTGKQRHQDRDKLHQYNY
jgi:hypothetical protein